MTLKSPLVFVEKEITLLPHTSQAVLPTLEEILGEANIALSDITSVRVATGPGSFTGLRVGLAVGNVLSTLLNVPVNGKPPGTPITLIYESSKFDATSP